MTIRNISDLSIDAIIDHKYGDLKTGVSSSYDSICYLCFEQYDIATKD